MFLQLLLHPKLLHIDNEFYRSRLFSEVNRTLVKHKQSDIDELTVTVLKSDSSVIGEFDTKHLLEFAKTVVYWCHIYAIRHDHKNLRLIWFIRNRAFNIPSS